MTAGGMGFIPERLLMMMMMMMMMIMITVLLLLLLLLFVLLVVVFLVQLYKLTSERGRLKPGGGECSASTLRGPNMPLSYFGIEIAH